MKIVRMWGRETRIPDIGERVTRRVTTKGHELNRDKMEGTVIYVHPEYRFFTLEFDAGGRTYRESYILGR